MPTRSLALACAILSAVAPGACATRDLHPSPNSENRWSGVMYALRSVDILFVIDDSSGMAAAQGNLTRNFPALMAALQADPAGLPILHVAVVSSDLGAGDGSIAGCDATGGKQGIFQYTARGTCTSSNLEAGATYISNFDGTLNYTGNIEDVFGCIAALGESGCNFAHPFAAVLRATGADGLGPPPAENQGFITQDAALAVVMLANEDDCSASLGSGPNGRIPLFDSAFNTNMASQLGPPTHFRCNEFGHLCARAGGDRMRPDRNAPNQNPNATVAYDQCSSDDADGFLLSTKDVANQLKSLKADPAQVMVASIQGSAAPYVVNWTTPSPPDSSCGASSCPWPEISHACTAADGSFADPGVRTGQLAEAFGTNGLQMSVCDSSFGPALTRIGEMINQVLGPRCIPGAIALDPAGQPDCKVTMMDGLQTVGLVPSCAAVGGLAPCWQIESSATCSSGHLLHVFPDPALPRSGAVRSVFDCAKCPSGTPSAQCI